MEDRVLKEIRKTVIRDSRVKAVREVIKVIKVISRETSRVKAVRMERKVSE
jgi:hypothetical protein